jgi:hypothetical protein
VIILRRNEELRIQHFTKFRRVIMGFVDVFDVLGGYSDLVGS